MLSKIAVLCASSLIAAGLISCATDNSPKPQPLLAIKNSATLNLGWLQRAPLASYPGSFVPTNFDNAIFTADSGGYIYKLDSTDGSIISQFYLRRNLSSGIGVNGDTLYVTSSDGYLLAVNKVSGRIKWQAQLPTLSIEAPQATNDLVVVRTNDAELLAFNASDGTPIWIYQKPIPALTLRVTATFQIIENQVIAVGMPGGKLALLNLKTGTPIWENYIAVPDGATDLDKITDIGMRPVINNKLLCIATYNGKLACVDALTSNIVWQKKFSSSAGVVVDEQNLYAVASDGVVAAFDKTTGATVWQNKSLQYRSLSAPALLGNGVIVIDNNGYVHMFDRSDGQEVARLNTILTGGVAVPLVRDNGIYYQSADGYLAQIKNY